MDRVIIVLADTRANRAALRSVRSAWRADYPLDGDEVRDVLRAGGLPRAGGVILV
jgi:hypothetical protein